MIISLAEGLQELGIPFFSNINYWPLSTDRKQFLFNYRSDISFDQCDIVILNHIWFVYGGSIPVDLFKKGRKYKTAFMDHKTGLYSYGFQKEFRLFDVILRGHFTRAFGNPSNMRPWAFGLSKRIIDATLNQAPWARRNNILLSNFRIDHNVRDQAQKVLYPQLAKIFTIVNTAESFSSPKNVDDRFQWEKTGRRHYSEYYQKLKESKASSCFGGFYHSKLIKWPRLNRFFDKSIRSRNVFQWESYRLWEAFAAGNLVFHLDLEKYGCRMPVMPMNLAHYIGIDFNNLDKSSKIVQEHQEQYEQIALSGKTWALQHYSPVAVARRFLEIFGYESGYAR